MRRNLLPRRSSGRGRGGRVGAGHVSLAACPAPVLLALPLVLAGFFTAAASGATAGFITLPGARSTTAPAAETPPCTQRTAAAATSLAAPPATRQVSAVRLQSSGGRLFPSAFAESDGGTAKVANEKEEQDRRMRATKTALLGWFGEGIDDGAAADGAKSDPILACPATLGDLTDVVRSYGGIGPAALLASYKASEKMPGTKYRVEVDFVDFAEPPKPAWKQSKGDSVKEGTFQSPVVTWLYERGWRQRFRLAGFPGFNEEFRQVMEYFSSTGADGGTVIDLSCGSGLMMRRLVASGRYSRVIGGDLSATMLAETARRFKQERLGVPELIRCDASRLPLKTASLDGVHAGAALHCWSKLEESLSEVHRALKPGKGFFATTFLTYNLRGPEGYKYFEVDELESLLRDAGFADVKVVKSGICCAIIRATKED